MSSLSDRLKLLGVKVGAQQLAPPARADVYPIEAVLKGERIQTPAGETFVVEKDYAPDYRHGAVSLLCEAPVNILSHWAGDENIQSFERSEFAFLDTETSGLAGGTGTYAFLVGVGRFVGQVFHLAQFFMRDPTEEPALLLALESFLAPCKALVTFNGKSFDAPLLNTRFKMAGWQSPLYDLRQIDLLHISRRLWRDQLASRTLGNLEVQILQIARSEEEVPGWLIPQLYFDYLRTGDARAMKSVFYHNAMDVVSMAALFNRITIDLEDPYSPLLESVERAAVARLYEDLGKFDEAAQLYEASLNEGLPEDLFWDSLHRLALLHKRRSHYHMAVPLWEKAARHQRLEAFIELAKAYEHIFKEIDQAIHWTRQALQIIEQPGFPAIDRRMWQPDLERRLERLISKVNDN